MKCKTVDIDPETQDTGAGIFKEFLLENETPALILRRMLADVSCLGGARLLGKLASRGIFSYWFLIFERIPALEHNQQPSSSFVSFKR